MPVLSPAAAVRSSRPDVRNPVLALPETRELAAVLAEHPEIRARVVALLGALSVSAHAQADKSWLQRKAPLAAYWRAWGVNWRHLRLALRSVPGEEG